MFAEQISNENIYLLWDCVKWQIVLNSLFSRFGLQFEPENAINKAETHLISTDCM